MVKKMKIGILFDSTMDTNDGVQQYVKSLGRELKERGHNVKFLVADSEKKGEFAKEIINVGKSINIHGNGNKLSVAIFKDNKLINKTLKREKFDILHVQMPYSPFVSGNIINKAQCPIVATFHILPNDWIVELSNKILSLVQKKSLKKLNKIIAVSPSAKDFVEQTYHKDATVIPNMVSLPKFSTTKSIDKFNDEKFNILFFGRLVPRKGAIYLIKAFERLDPNIKRNSRLIIAGKGERLHFLHKYVKEKEIQNIEFLGFIKESMKEKVYNSADICVFPATGGESFGIVLLEAMAAGKAVIGFDNPGYKSVLRDYHDYSLVENKNIDQLSLRINKLIEDKNILMDMANRSIKYVKRFDTTKVVDQIIDLYQDCID
jgi:phosphatidylinositol alpha-mannosyltransferase